MSSIRHTIVSLSLGTALALVAGSALLSPTAPARLASPRMAPVESKLATVDTLLSLQALWERPALDAARRALAEELNALLQTKQAEVSASEAQLQQTVQTLQVRFNALPDGDPERDQIRQAFEMQQEVHNQRAAAFQAMQDDASQRVDVQRASQLRESHAALLAAIATVAQREGYTHVISHSSNKKQFEADGFEGVLQGIRDRPVVFAPQGTDVTDMVLAELGVPRPAFQAGDSGGGEPGAAGPGVPVDAPSQPATPPGE